MAAKALVDGSILEGGGQILRNSVALAALLSKELTINRIRNGRKPPGLKNQHRTGLQLASEISGGSLHGAENGSTEIQFSPGNLLDKLPNHFSADSVTAGATTLLLQIAFPLLLFTKDANRCTPSSLTLKGGTNATQAPQADYAQHILLPFMKRHFEIESRLDIKRRGYFPKGGGELFVQVHPTLAKLPAITLLERGNISTIHGIAHYGGLPDRIGQLMASSAERHLRDSGYESVFIHPAKADVNGPGSGIVLWANLEGGGILGASAVGRKSTDATKVGVQAATELLGAIEDGGCVDEWLQDQIIIFMALAEGHSQVRCGRSDLTLHAKTAIWIAEHLTEAKFNVSKNEEGYTIVECDGIGFQPSTL